MKGIHVCWGPHAKGPRGGGDHPHTSMPPPHHPLHIERPSFGGTLTRGL